MPNDTIIVLLSIGVVINSLLINTVPDLFTDFKKGTKIKILLIVAFILMLLLDAWLLTNDTVAMNTQVTQSFFESRWNMTFMLYVCLGSTVFYLFHILSAFVSNKR